MKLKINFKLAAILVLAFSFLAFHLASAQSVEFFLHNDNSESKDALDDGSKDALDDGSKDALDDGSKNGSSNGNMPGVSQDEIMSVGNDAIAVRVLPNPNHYSAARWYESQGFSGSPQSLLVDSYDAVRDGRSVYVNAANVDLVNKTIYTNIYLISYNQDPNVTTVDVLGQIVDHWQFNSNLNSIGACSISTLNCNSDEDCSQDMTCLAIDNTAGHCKLLENDACYTDSDCSQGLYCDNLRSKVSRDVRRLGVLGNLREALSVFKQTNGKYPVLQSGTYIPFNSISVWPSWQSLFLPQLGLAQLTIDPVNSLGVCDGFDATSCWNEEEQVFADPDLSNSILELPDQSYVFSYDSDSNGSNYNLCAVMETKAMGYNTAEGELSEMGCIASGSGYTGSSNNLPPVLVDTNLYGEQNQSFNGFIKVIDPENNPLSWSIDTSGVDWSSWSAAPVLQDTYNSNQKKIYALKAGLAGVYNVVLNVTDVEGETMSTNTPIVISNDAPLIQSDDVDYYPSTVIPLTINFSITDKDYPLNYEINKSLNNSGPYDLLASDNAVFLGETSHRSGDTSYYTLKYNLLTSNKFLQDTSFVYLITATDNYNVVSSRQIRINIKVDLPVLDFNCAKSSRLGNSYYCGLGWEKQGDHTISYTSVGNLPAGLSISDSSSLPDPGSGSAVNLNPGQNILNYLGLNNILHKAEAATSLPPIASPIPYYSIKGTPTVASSDNLIIIKAENEFGAISQREFNLAINNYCGDGEKQQPNLEGRGGFYNDGQEDCDGNGGIVLSRDQIASSSSIFQYACSTVVGAETPYPITSSEFFCTFLDDEINGGFCGDGICQMIIEKNGESIDWEDINNCEEDCANDSCGVNASYDGSECVCDAGWFNCDDVPGCETTVDCSCVDGYKDFDMDGWGISPYGCYVPSNSYNVASQYIDCDDNYNNVFPGNTGADIRCADSEDCYGFYADSNHGGDHDCDEEVVKAIWQGEESSVSISGEPPLVLYYAKDNGTYTSINANSYSCGTGFIKPTANNGSWYTYSNGSYTPRFYGEAIIYCK